MRFEMRPPFVLLATLALLETAACDTFVTTTVRLRDPAAVEVRAGERTVIPAGAAVTEGQIAAGSIAMRDSSSSAYQVRVAREASGALSLTWVTKLALSNGERHVLMGADGTVPLATEASDLGLPRDGATPLVIPECGWLTEPSRGVRSSTSGQPCSANVHFRASLVTPWSNVLEVREERTDHQRMYDADYNFNRILMGTMGLAALAVPDIAAAVIPFKPALTGTIIGASVLLAVPVLYLMFRPLSRSTVVYSAQR